MRSLEGGCSVPIGVETELVGHRLMMRASVSSVDGKRHVAAEETAEDVVDVVSAEEFGRAVAGRLLEGGAGDILKDIVRAKETSAQAAEVSRKEEKLVDAIEAVHAQQQQQ